MIMKKIVLFVKVLQNAKSTKSKTQKKKKKKFLQLGLLDFHFFLAYIRALITVMLKFMIYLVATVSKFKTLRALLL